MQSFRTLWSSRRRHVSLAAALLASVACASGELQEGLGPQSASMDSAVAVSGSESKAIQGLTLSPTSATLAPGASRQFNAIGWIDGRSSPAPNAVWVAEGGTITQSGLYTAGSRTGTYRIAVKSFPTGHVEVATVTISGSAQPTGTISKITVTPGDLSLERSVTQQFTATAQLSNGTTQANPPVTWSATGGTISSTGSYRTGGTFGTFRVIARSANGRADTSRVVITTSSISSISVTPATATVAAGASQQFTATARLTNGAIQTNPPVTWTATGGTITSAGRYTAGSSAGTFRVIARSSNGRADTSTVTVTAAAAPTVTGVTLTPANVNLSAGGTQAFSTQVTYSNGTTQTNPTLSWSATGGSMGSGQVFTAGSSAGTYRVIASLNGRADTSTVTISASAPPPPSGSNHMYFNSAEGGCGTDSNVLFCDDFEDGDWYTVDTDRASNEGTAGYLKQDGWHGTIYGNPITPATAAYCGSRGAKGSNCAATYGALDGTRYSRNMADHAFNGGPVEEVWARWYYKADAGYRWGAEKHTNFTKAAGDITWFNIQFNCGSGGGNTTAIPHIQIIHGTNPVCQTPNVSSINLESGKWYFFEVHAKLNSSGTVQDGLIEMWINDCGTSGVCTGSPTLRTRMINVGFQRNQPGCTTSPCKIEVLWFESWANPRSSGQAYLDQIKASKRGPIGF